MIYPVLQGCCHLCWRLLIIERYIWSECFGNFLIGATGFTFFIQHLRAKGTVTGTQRAQAYHLVLYENSAEVISA